MDLHSFNIPDKFLGVTPHPNAINIVNFELFWDNYCFLSPFGNDVASSVFVDFAVWFEDNPGGNVIEYIEDTLSYWGLNLEDYNDSILEYRNIEIMAEDYDFDELVLSVDWSILAIGFGQLVIEGRIDRNIKDIVQLAILRQRNSFVLDYFLNDNENLKHLRFVYLTHLLDILEKA